jgi:hypothetical protein
MILAPPAAGSVPTLSVYALAVSGVMLLALALWNLRTSEKV